MPTNDARLVELMSAAQTGDRDAYEQLLESVTPLLRRVVRRQRAFLGADEVEDLVQEILLSGFPSWARWPATLGDSTLRRLPIFQVARDKPWVHPSTPTPRLGASEFRLSRLNRIARPRRAEVDVPPAVFHPKMRIWFVRH